MRFLADENCPRDLVRRLRALGHEVAWVREDSPGASDREVLARAQRERRVLATFDTGFGELAFRAGARASCGVVLIRIHGASPGIQIDRVLTVVQGRRSWTGLFASITETGLRIRTLPRRTGEPS